MYMYMCRHYLYLADKLFLREIERSQREGVGGEEVVGERGAGRREDPHCTVTPGEEGEGEKRESEGGGVEMREEHTYI